MKFFWFSAAFGAICGLLTMMFGYASAKSAPQEAAIAAMAVAAAVVPYVFARSLQLFGQHERDERRHQEVLAALRAGHAVTPERAPSAAPPTGLGSSSPTPEAPPVQRTNWN